MYRGAQPRHVRGVRRHAFEAREGAARREALEHVQPDLRVGALVTPGHARALRPMGADADGGLHRRVLLVLVDEELDQERVLGSFVPRRNLDEERVEDPRGALHIVTLAKFQQGQLDGLRCSCCRPRALLRVGAALRISLGGPGRAAGSVRRGEEHPRGAAASYDSTREGEPPERDPREGARANQACQGFCGGSCCRFGGGADRFSSARGCMRSLNRTKPPHTNKHLCAIYALSHTSLRRTDTCVRAHRIHMN